MQSRAVCYTVFASTYPTSSFWSLIHFLSLCFFLLVIILSVFFSVIFPRFSLPPPPPFTLTGALVKPMLVHLRALSVCTTSNGTMVTKIMDWKRHGRTWSRTNSQYCTIPRYGPEGLAIRT